MTHGLVRVEWWTEKVAPPVQDIPIVRHHYVDEWHWYYPYYRRPYWYGDIWCGNMTTPTITSCMTGGNLQGASSTFTASMQSAQAKSGTIRAMNCSTTPTNSSIAPRPEGITVPGSESRQQFTSVAGFPTFPQSEVLVLHLQGEVGGTPVAAPITVEAKPTCSTCGKVNKATHRFCSECGTALTLL